MPEHREVSKVQRFFDFMAGVPSDDPQVRDWIYRAIINSRIAVPSSTFASMILWISAVLITGDTWPYYLMVVDLLVLSARLYLIYRRNPDFEARAFAAGAVAILGNVWGFILGLGGAVIIIDGNPTVTLSACSVIGGIVGVVSFRNASTPRSARILTLVILAPAVSSLWLTGDFQYQVLAVSVIPWAVVLLLMITQNSKVIRASAEAHVALYRAARTDALTGLWNRFRFNEYIDELNASGNSENVSVLHLDLDGFKGVNDTHGHQVGDAVLTQIANRMREVVRDGDRLFRLGGDEFAVMLTDTPNVEIDRIASSLLGALRSPLYCGPGLSLSVSISIGSATKTDTGSIVSMIRAADDALYVAKSEGKDRHVADRRTVAHNTGELDAFDATI